MTNDSIKNATDNAHTNWQDHADMDMLNDIDRQLDGMIEDSIDAQMLIESAVFEICHAGREAIYAERDATNIMRELEEHTDNCAQREIPEHRMIERVA